MTISKEFLSILACPKCKNGVEMTSGQDGLLCNACNVVYPIKSGIPVMLVEEAVAAGAPISPSQKKPEPKREPQSRPKSEAEIAEPSSGDAAFKIVEGKQKGTIVYLKAGTCRAIGRSIDDAEKTQIFSVDSLVSLDDFSKKVVMSYIERQFRSAAEKKSEDPHGVGSFRRDTDLALSDSSVSRLHAMIFYDKSGVGILDLVSKNGTFVNGTEIESKLLKRGDVISIGSTKIRYE